MADYYSQTVVQQTIPVSNITSLELLCLTNMFQSEQHDEHIYFFASDSIADVIWVDRDELVVALAAPENGAYATMEEFRGPLGKWRPSDSSVMLDLSMVSWEPFVQNIVKRSPTLQYVSAMTAYSCSKMRDDGFGGMAVLITAESISLKDTNDILEEMLEKAGIAAE